MDKQAISCPVINENGKRCGSELNPKSNLCPICGPKVETALLQRGNSCELFVYTREITLLN